MAANKSTQLEAIEAELASLEDKLEAAHAKKASAGKELEELAPRRREINDLVLLDSQVYQLGLFRFGLYNPRRGRLLVLSSVLGSELY